MKACGVLINITGGYDMTLFEADEAATRIREEVDPDANIIFGSTFEEKLAGRMRISVVATGIEADKAVQPRPLISLVSDRTKADAPRAALRRSALAAAAAELKPSSSASPRCGPSHGRWLPSPASMKVEPVAPRCRKRTDRATGGAQHAVRCRSRSKPRRNRFRRRRRSRPYAHRHAEAGEPWSEPLRARDQGRASPSIARSRRSAASRRS